MAAAGARTATDIDSLVADIKEKYNMPALVLIGDVTKDPAAVVAKVEKELGAIDILINNAGTMRRARFTEESSLDAWWWLFELNVKAPMALIHAILPSFLKHASAESPNTIITIGSTAADLTFPFMTAYNASKAAIHKSIQILDLELRSQNIYNFVLHPGNIPTDLNQMDSAYLGDEMRDMMRAYVQYMLTQLALPADSMVALAALLYGGDERVGVLSGRLWDVEDDLEEMLGKKEEIEEKGLYHLRTRKL